MRKTDSPTTVYTLTIVGTAFVRDPQTALKSEKPYRVQVVMDREQVAEGALSQFAKHWARDNMPAVLPGYVNLYTFGVESCVTSDGKLPHDINLMNQFDLASFISNQEYPIETELYEDVNSLRQAVLLYEQDKPAFSAQQDRSMKLKGKHIQLRKRMRELNPRMEAKEMVYTNIAPGVVLGAVKLEDAPDEEAYVPVSSPSAAKARDAKL